MIDADLGVTASSTAGRSGFQVPVASVNLGQVGIIFAYDVMRLATTARIGINSSIFAVTVVASSAIKRRYTTRPRLMAG